MANIIEVQNLTKRYKKAKENAVDGISFSVGSGELFAFLGPNGAGKTTSISILTTTLSKTSGSVTIAGYNLDTHQKEVRSQIGVIFQKPSLDPNLTAEENIRFHSVLYGDYPFYPSYSLMPEEYKTKVQHLAEVLDITRDIFKPIRTFSGGMKRKLEIVRSLMHEPKILFLDEATAGLDPESRQNLWAYLREVRKSHDTTMFITTHYLEEAEDSDHVCIINKGKIVSYGTPDEIKRALIEEYLVVDSPNREHLLKELKAHTYAYEEGEHIKIILNSADIQTIIQSIKTPLTYIKTHTPTLEEAYLEVIKDEGA